MTEDNKPEGGQPPEEAAKPKPKTFDEAFKALTMTEEEAAKLEEETYEESAQTPMPRKSKVDEKDEPSALEKAAEANPDAPHDPNAIPDWVEIPEGFKIPPGKQVGFVRFRSSLTEKKNGDHNAIIWGLTDADEKLAIKATRGDSGRTISEMTKRMFRAIDGHRADWTGKIGPGNVEMFWNDIGPRYRQILQNIYLTTHALTREERADFFLSCLVFRTSEVG